MAKAKLPTLEQATWRCQREYILDLLERYKGNVTHAARVAGLNRTAFYRTTARLRIKVDEARSG